METKPTYTTAPIVEPEPEQTAATPPVITRDIRCACGATMGKLVEIDGCYSLVVGSVAVYSINGACAKCGRAFHWTTGEQLLKRILERSRGNTFRSVVK